MILADKIINERKKNGWSQEDLADKLGVSRQSVSKWEGAQSIPDLQKIVMMAQIFNVSTDYLLKDEIEALDRPEETLQGNQEASDENKVRVVSLQEANDFMTTERTRAPKMALGVALCILCPVVLIFLTGASEAGLFGLTETASTFIGLAVLFLMIAAGVYYIIAEGRRKEDYEPFETEDLETAYGVTGLAKERRVEYQDTYNRRLTLSIIMYVLCALPLILVAVLEASDFVVISMVCVLLIIVAASTYNIIIISTIMNSFEMLLQDRDFTKEKKRETKKTSRFSGPYWTLITAIYLAIGFITDQWDRTWIIWPIAAVVFPVLAAIARAIASRSER